MLNTRIHPHPPFLGMLQEFSRNTKFLDIIIHLNLRNLVCREDSDRLLGERISKPLPTCLCTHAQHPGPCPLSTVERLDVTCGLTEGMAHMSFPHKLVFQFLYGYRQHLSRGQVIPKRRAEGSWVPIYLLGAELGALFFPLFIPATRKSRW